MSEQEEHWWGDITNTRQICERCGITWDSRTAKYLIDGKWVQLDEVGEKEPPCKRRVR